MNRIGYALVETRLSCGSLDQYRIETPNKNCETGKMVDSIAECITASNILGLRFINYTVIHDNAPAGCHRQISGSPSIKNFGIFNNIDPSMTKPSTFKTRVAICRCDGRFNKANA